MSRSGRLRNARGAPRRSYERPTACVGTRKTLWLRTAWSRLYSPAGFCASLRDISTLSCPIGSGKAAIFRTTPSVPAVEKPVGLDYPGISKSGQRDATALVSKSKHRRLRCIQGARLPLIHARIGRFVRRRQLVHAHLTTELGRGCRYWRSRAGQRNDAPSPRRQSVRGKCDERRSFPAAESQSCVQTYLKKETRATQ